MLHQLSSGQVDLAFSALGAMVSGLHATPLWSDRLVALGATRLGDRDDGVELADPGGHEFVVA